MEIFKNESLKYMKKLEPQLHWCCKFLKIKTLYSNTEALFQSCTKVDLVPLSKKSNSAPQLFNSSFKKAKNYNDTGSKNNESPSKSKLLF